MQLRTLLDKLNYSGSENFVRRGSVAFERAPDVGHIFRSGRKGCNLEGVYTLRPPTEGDPPANSGSLIPVVYVCTANDAADANRVHRLVWNQDIVPFLLVYTPEGVLLYSGFQHGQAKNGTTTGLLEPLRDFNKLDDLIEDFHATTIDSGELWRRRGTQIRPDARVYWSLLKNLKQLEQRLLSLYQVEKFIIHRLMGKYVYLHYLKDREFLSRRRLDEWKIDPGTVYGRNATVKGLQAVCEKLDEFLNGRVFPLKFRGNRAPNEIHIQRVAGAFAGDEFTGEDWQFHLPFTAYDFSYIPIETLSMIYEQFLHLPDDEEDDGPSEGRKAGAYYTPIPVVNFMLAELEERRPLHRGISVFDPSCGSGAFLVQCYRRLIEQTFPTSRKKPTPTQLSQLLRQHIFGIDLDDDACSVAEFSLYLTLLDYVEPGDLIDHPRFRLPCLRNKNVFNRDFFASQPFGQKRRFHWIVGNPPWKKLDTANLDERDKPAIKWMREHSHDRPVGNYAVAQSFAWRCREFLHPRGECALLLPAMTLFEDPSLAFRKAFFRAHRVHSVANFSNLAEVLFARRSRVPAAAIFFGTREAKTQPDDLELTTVFSPLVANQEPTRPVDSRVRNEIWSLVVNADEVRELPYCDLSSGSGLPWKLATWGSILDEALLQRLGRKWQRLEDYEAYWNRTKRQFQRHGETGVFGIGEGPELKLQQASGCVAVRELHGKPILDVEMLKRARRIFSFKNLSLPINERRFLNTRHGWKGVPLSRPPHVMVSAARNYAVFSDDYLVFKNRQIGIVHVDDNRTLLKALALYLSSDFAYYHQFFTTTELGVKRDRATLEALRQIPMPLLDLRTADLRRWEQLHDRLAQTQPRFLPDSRQPEAELGDDSEPDDQDRMLSELNTMVFEALELDEAERALVDDLVHVRLALNDGKLGAAAMDRAQSKELKTYGEWFRSELMSNLEQNSRSNVSVNVVHDDHSGFVVVDFTADQKAAAGVRVTRADAEAAATLIRTRTKLRETNAQWVYFDRALRIYRSHKVYLFKPIHRMHWTRTRAMLDAADVAIGYVRET